MNLIVLGGLTGVILMLSGIFLKKKQQASILALVLFLLMLVANTWEMYYGPLFNFETNNMVKTTRFGLLINGILLFALSVYTLINKDQVERVGNHVAEYYALMCFIMSGIGIATSYTNLLMLFLGIEIITIPLYILTGSDKRNLKSIEAALKYFLMGAFSTGLMLMGIALIYGGIGSFSLAKFNLVASPISYNLVAGFLLVLVSMAFKVSAVPFHFWTPDVYDGAPTVFTSFMATIVKIGAFAAFIKLFEGSIDILDKKWQLVMSIIIALTLVVGNITAVFQQSVKRMLAYSSIAQAGFMLFALFAFNQWSREGMVLYAASYCLATIGLFAILVRLDDYTFDGFNGFAKSHPALAMAAAIFVLSLAGIPLTAGFFSKYYMVSAALSTGGKYLWLSILAMLCAAISVYYYFRVIQAMYFKAAPAEAPVIESSRGFTIAVCGMAALIIFIGVLPQWLLQFLYF